LEPGSSAYNIVSALRIRGPLNDVVLAKALAEVVRRHEILRTRFVSHQGQPSQRIDDSTSIVGVLVRHDLSGKQREEQEAEVAKRTEDEGRTGFNLELGPLVRGHLLLLSEEEHVLLISMHHIVSDGWSMGVLVREMTALYEAYREGRESPLPELKIQYADYAVWQREWLQGEVLEGGLKYWRERLEGAGVLELPSDRPRPAVMTHLGATEGLVLSEDLRRGLRELGRREGVTLF